MVRGVILGRTLLPVQAVKLGRLVIDCEEPLADYFDLADTGSLNGVTTKQTDYSYTSCHNADAGFTLQLTQLISAARKKTRKTNTTITTQQTQTHRLDNSTPFFRNAVRSLEARKWIERAIDQGDTIYMVVGFITLMNALIVEDVGVTGAISSSVEVPLTTTLAASTGIILPGVGDPAVAGHAQHGESDQVRYVASGECICAIQYRRVKTSWFNSKDLDKAKLDKTNRWITYASVRGQGEEGEDDVVDADLDEADDSLLQSEETKEVTVWNGDVYII